MTKLANGNQCEAPAVIALFKLDSGESQTLDVNDLSSLGALFRVWVCVLAQHPQLVHAFGEA